MISQLVVRYRWLIVVAIGVLALWLLSHRWDEFAESLTVLTRIDPRWMIVLGLAQGVSIALSALTFRVALRLLGHDVSLPRLIDIHLKRHLVSTVTPLGGPASVYVFVRSLYARGISTNDAMFAMMLRGIVGYTAFVLFIIPVAIAFRPSGFVLAATGVLLISLIALVALLVGILQGRAIPTGLQRRLPQRVVTFAEESRSHGIRIRQLLPLLLIGVLANLGNVVVLFIALRAVGAHASLTSAATGYAVGNLFQILSPIFQGIGLVEVSMVATLRSLDITSTSAIGATMLFRLADLWLPFVAALVLHAVRMSVRYVPVALGSVGMSARALVANRPLAFPTAAVSVVAIPALILVSSVGNSDLLATMLVFIDARLGIPHLSMPFLVSTGAAFG